VDGSKLINGLNFDHHALLGLQSRPPTLCPSCPSWLRGEASQEP